MKAYLSWGEDFPALFLTTENTYFDTEVDLPERLVQGYRAAKTVQHDMIQAMREHCERTGQSFPEEP